MQKLLLLVLVLAAVALSSSNVLPVQFQSMNDVNTQPLSFDYQDDTYRNNQQSRNKLNAILFNVDINPNIDKIAQEKYLDINEDFSSINKVDNYNVKGFRKEQWHNYPRQLDRLNRYFYEQHNTDKRNLDPDDPGNVYSGESVERLERSLDSPNEYQIQNDLELSKINQEAEVAAAVINPLLIFRIHLACYNRNLRDTQPSQLDTVELDNDKLQETNKKENIFNDPESNLIKVKREDKINLADDESYKNSSENRTVNKRIFSLWSRLQSLNPKGHQLHHRRHMYALYGPPDTEGGGPPPGILTAETRATFMRPPGSPLRWG